MSASTKLSSAVKALCFLAETHPDPQNSSQISNHVGTNASKLRKLLSLMCKTGLVESTKGTSGGFLLKKIPTEIDLQEIYCAIEDRKAFHLDVNSAEGENKDGNIAFNNFFHVLFTDIQVDIEMKMKTIKLSSIMKDAGIGENIGV